MNDNQTSTTTLPGPQVRELLVRADSALSLIYHRASRSVPWTTIGGEGFQEQVRQLYEDLRAAYSTPKPKDFAYDPDCKDLAIHFLSECDPHVPELAQHIQDAIDDWFSSQEAR